MKRRIAIVLGVLAIFHTSVFAQALEREVAVTLHSGATSNVDGALIPVRGYDVLGLDVAISGTATVTLQGKSSDTGAFQNVYCYNRAANTSSATTTAAASLQCAITGLIAIKAPITSCSGCAVTVRGTLTTGSSIAPASSATSTVVGAGVQALDVTLKTLLSGENQTLNELYTSDSGIAVRYTTTGDKNVKASAGEVVGILAASGTSVTAVIWDDADGTCSSNQLSGTLALTNGTFLKFPSRHSTGICITVGGTSPVVTVFYK